MLNAAGAHPSLLLPTEKRRGFVKLQKYTGGYTSGFFLWFLFVFLLLCFFLFVCFAYSFLRHKGYNRTAFPYMEQM